MTGQSLESLGLGKSRLCFMLYILYCLDMKKGCAGILIHPLVLRGSDEERAARCVWVCGHQAGRCSALHYVVVGGLEFPLPEPHFVERDGNHYAQMVFAEQAVGRAVAVAVFEPYVEHRLVASEREAEAAAYAVFSYVVVPYHDV